MTPIGQVLGHSRVLAHLGRGAMGEVFRAEDSPRSKKPDD
jgi:hypothetical protein